MEKLIAQFKALPQWQRALILVVIPIALIAYVWVTLISPVREEIKKTKVEIEKVKAEINNIRASLDPSTIEKLRKEEENLKTELDHKREELVRLAGELPEEGEISTLLRNIGQVAKKSGVSVLSMQVSPPQPTTYALIEEGERKIVKEVQQQQQQQQQQKPQHQQSAPLKSANFMRSELKLSLLGSYVSVRSFIDSLRKEGIISYPLSLTLTPQEDKIKAEIIIYLLMKAKGGES